MKLDMHDALRRCEMTMTVNVHMGWRVRLGLWIATLGLRLTGMGVKINQDAE
jgi:hypothetical protein